MHYFSSKADELTIKVILVGDSNVGKTHLIHQFAKANSDIETVPTLSFEIVAKKVKIGEADVNFQFWDTAGCERFRSLARGYYCKADAVIFVYDKTKRQSFDNLGIWLKEVEDNCDNDDVLKILVGNKMDLVDQVQVNYDNANEFGKKNYMLFREVSATKYRNVDALFRDIFNELQDQARAKVAASLGNDSLLNKPSSVNGCC